MDERVFSLDEFRRYSPDHTMRWRIVSRHWSSFC